MISIETAKEHYKNGRMDKAFDESFELLSADRHLIEAWGIMAKCMVDRWNPGQENRKGAILKGVSGVARNAEDIEEMDRIIAEIRMTIYDRKYNYAEKFCRIQKTEPSLQGHMDDVRKILEAFDELAGREIDRTIASPRRILLKSLGYSPAEYVNAFAQTVIVYDAQIRSRIDELFVTAEDND